MNMEQTWRFNDFLARVRVDDSNSDWDYKKGATSTSLTVAVL